MGFDNSDFENSVNRNSENEEGADNNVNIESNSDGIENNVNPADKDLDDIIRKHSDSLARVAEDIPKRDGTTDNVHSEKAEAVNSSSESVNLDKSSAGETDAVSATNIVNTANYSNANGESKFSTEDRRNVVENDVRIKPENVQGRSSFAQPQKGKERKKSKVGKAVGLVFSAAVFGLVAGGVMVGVNTVATGYMGSVKAGKDSEIVIGNKQDNDNKAETTSAPAKNLSTMDVSSIVDSAMPSVVSIYGKAEVTANGFFGPQSYEQQSSGSGIIVGKTDTELLVVTNNHVISGTDSLEVEFVDGKKAAASVKGGDSDNDVAVVAIKLSDLSEDTLSRISIANIGNSDSLKVGQGVVAIGNALGYGQSVTVGYISALNREIQTEDGTTKDLLQTDAAINPGNSGGALLNMQGEVIGINSAKYSDTAVEGMGYAIPISKVKDLIKELSSKETRTVVDEENQGYLGIQGKDVDSEMAKAYDMPQGIYVYKVVEGGAAASSDLKAKDIITKFDGQTVRSMADLKNMLTYYESGRTVDITVQRLDVDGNYVEKTVSITLGSRDIQEQ